MKSVFKKSQSQNILPAALQASDLKINMILPFILECYRAGGPVWQWELHIRG